jgi:hypothetical protein
VRRQDRRVGVVTCKLVGFDRFLHVQARFNRGRVHPAVQRGLEVTAGQVRKNEGENL